jgi:glycosyltransferase involved in cell wall biosynthesis
VSGTGIKTKVLEAMALGLPVLSTVHGVAGLQVEHKKHCFICEQPGEFAEGMRYLRDVQAAGRIGDNARQYIEANFSSHVLRQRWAGVIRELESGRAAPAC